MKEMNLEETLHFKRHVKMYLSDLGSGTVNDSVSLLRAANHHFKRILELSGYDDAHELDMILDPFAENPDGSPVFYRYYFDKMREKGLHIMNDEEIEMAKKAKRKKEVTR